MEYEQDSSSEHNTSDTPESIQECFRLKNAIESQLDDWCSTLEYTHPSIAQRGIAALIVSNCTPKNRSNDDLEGSPFELGLTPKTIEHIKEKRQRLDLITSIAQNDSFDNAEEIDEETNEDALEEYFERIIHLTENPNNPQQPKDAVRYLRRIYTAEKLISNRLEAMVRPNSQNYKYVLLLERLFNDL